MDNVTHTLIGLAAGEAVAVHRKKARIPIWIASAVANNLPDLDVILTSFFFRGKINYFLHHRGHSHTLLLSPLLTLLILLPLFLFWRKKEVPWKEVVFVSFLGPPLHIFSDYWNSYGVHPFWPFNMEWFYGDMAFIVEPWIWVLLLPALFFACATVWGKGVCLLLLGGILTLSWIHDFVAWQTASSLTAATAFLLFLLSRWKERGPRIALALALTGTFLAFLGFTSRQLEARHARPGSEFALTPYPANPFCWISMDARIDETEYSARTAVLAPFPAIVAASACPPPHEGEITAPLQPPEGPASPDHWEIGTFRASRAEFDLLSRSCQVNAFLRFARIPFWKRVESGWIVGDLRYDRDAGMGFAEFFVPDTALGPEGKADCPQNVPPWRGRFHPDTL
jgi:inner membrane protein